MLMRCVTRSGTLAGKYQERLIGRYLRIDILYAAVAEGERFHVAVDTVLTRRAKQAQLLSLDSSSEIDTSVRCDTRPKDPLERVNRFRKLQRRAPTRSDAVDPPDMRRHGRATLFSLNGIRCERSHRNKDKE